METSTLFLRKKPEGFATKAIHAGCDPEQWASKAVVPPITLSSIFKQEEPGKYGYEYSRSGNPNRKVLEEGLAALEEAKYALCFSSGVAAICNVAGLLSSGDHVLCVYNIYGGTIRVFQKITSRMNIEASFLDVTDPVKFCSGLRPNTKMVWLESMTNPVLRVVDVGRVSSMTRNYNKNILIVVDNTFLSPYFFKPLDIGADIVVHSATKYLNGHSDAIMGAALLNDFDVYKRLKFLQNACGAVPSPFDCYLVTRGLKTLQIRMDQHMKNGLAVAKFLESHPSVERVLYPGLPSHPEHELARHIWAGCSGMCSFYIKGGLNESKIFLKSLKIFILGVSLGGYESLINFPKLMTSASLSESEQKKAGITDNFFRLSVGLESTEDLIKDLDHALRCAIVPKTKGLYSYINMNISHVLTMFLLLALFFVANWM